MQTAIEVFERDRRKFVWLLEELRERLRQATGEPPCFLPIRGIMVEIDYLELSQRCGFLHAPFLIAHTELDGKKLQTYDCHDPIERAWTRPIFRTDGEDIREDEPGVFEREARADLITMVETWLRALQTLPADGVRPVLSGVSVPMGNAGLAQDRLWRYLALGVKSFREGRTPFLLHWSEDDDALAYMRKLNALALYEGLAAEFVFFPCPVARTDGEETFFFIRDAADGQVTRINYVHGKPPTPDDCLRVSDILSRWQTRREDQLVPSPAATGNRTSPPLPTPPLRDDPTSEVPTLAQRLIAEGNSARFNGLKGCLRSALKGFRLACERNNKLDQSTVGPAHHEWLRRNAPENLTGRAAENEETWMTYVRQGATRLFGPRKDRSHVLTRSVVTPARADLKPKERSKQY